MNRFAAVVLSALVLSASFPEAARARCGSSDGGAVGDLSRTISDARRAPLRLSRFQPTRFRFGRRFSRFEIDGTIEGAPVRLRVDSLRRLQLESLQRRLQKLLDQRALRRGLRLDARKANLALRERLGIDGSGDLLGPTGYDPFAFP